MDSEGSPSFVDSCLQIRDDLLLGYGKKFLWLGGTSIPSIWLHDCFEKISILSIFLSYITSLIYCVLAL
jgi:hypothetical protein